MFLIASQDPNCIVMTIDMHLTIPPGFIEYIRRVSELTFSANLTEEGISFLFLLLRL